MIKTNPITTPKKNHTANTLNDYINQSLHDALTLMTRFEEAGMDIVMKDDYLALYDIYRRLQKQKQALPANPEVPTKKSRKGRERGQVYFIMIKTNPITTPKKNHTANTLNDYINQSLHDALTLMTRFEEAGMDIVMKDDYLALYDIYRRLQKQKQALPANPEPD